MSTPLADDIKAALDVRAQLLAAGIDADDPDLAELMDGECDVLDRLRKIVRFARWTEAQAKALGEMLTEGRDRKARLERKAESMRAMVLGVLSELALKKLDAPDFTASVSAGRPKVIITDAAAVPGPLSVVRREPNKTAIAEALKAGPVPGAELSNAEPVLTVRAR